MTGNRAAWAMAPHRALEVGDAPYVQPGSGEVLIRNRAVAINPVDWMIPYLGKRLFSWLQFPTILGSDLAGEVVATGDGVTRVRPGDRVLAFAAGQSQQRHRAAEGAFQQYTLALEHLTTPIPAQMAYTEACVVPLGLMTAACGLFQQDGLGLRLPAAGAKRMEEWVLITGGATSVGSNALQLAAAAGYKVVTTASPKNFAYVRSLGAAEVFDYRSKSLVQEMVAALAGKQVVGALAIAPGSVNTCIDVLARSTGRKFVANVSSPLSFDAVPPGDALSLRGALKLVPAVVFSQVRTWIRSRRRRVPVTFLDASSMIGNETGRYLFGDFLAQALAEGSFRPAPVAKVVGTSLEDIQKAFGVQRAGVSAAKIVVTLD